MSDGRGIGLASDGRAPANMPFEELDEIPYVADIGPVALLGANLRIRCDDERLAQFLRAFLESFPSADSTLTTLHLLEVGGRSVAYHDGVRVLELPTVPALARSLVWYLNTLALAAPTTRVQIHAAVASLDGRAVVLPGRSGAGKTTAVTALLLDGWQYLSDEVGDLEPETGLVHPYPRPLALEEGAWGLVPEALDRWPPHVPELVTDLRLVLPAALGAEPASPAQPIALVFPEVASGQRPTLVRLGRAEALERLLPLTLNRGPRKRSDFFALAEFVRRVECRRLVLDGVDGLADCIDELYK